MGRRIAIAGTVTVLLHIAWVATYGTSAGGFFEALFFLGVLVTVGWPLRHRWRERRGSVTDG